MKKNCCLVIKQHLPISNSWEGRGFRWIKMSYPVWTSDWLWHKAIIIYLKTITTFDYNFGNYMCSYSCLSVLTLLPVWLFSSSFSTYSYILNSTLALTPCTLLKRGEQYDFGLENLPLTRLRSKELKSSSDIFQKKPPGAFLIKQQPTEAQ